MRKQLVFVKYIESIIAIIDIRKTWLCYAQRALLTRCSTNMAALLHVVIASK